MLPLYDTRIVDGWMFAVSPADNSLIIVIRKGSQRQIDRSYRCSHYQTDGIVIGTLQIRTERLWWAQWSKHWL